MIGRIVFVCQAGRLEAQAVLLAASLRLHLPATVALVAAFPAREGALAQTTLAALAALDVGIGRIENPLAPDYLIGHKLAALALLAGPGLGLFLDSDVIALRPPDTLPDQLAAVPASAQHCSRQTWEYIYERADLPFPADAPPTLLSQETTAPYFNSGMIAIPGALAAPFAQHWTQCAREIDADPLVAMAAKRPYLDQTAFPVAAALCGQAIAPLDEIWNFRGWGWQLPQGSGAIFYHYQDMAKLRRQAESLAVARAARALSPQVTAALRDQDF